MLVWGSEEALEEEKIKRIVNREKFETDKNIPRNSKVVLDNDL